MRQMTAALIECAAHHLPHLLITENTWSDDDWMI